MPKLKPALILLVFLMTTGRGFVFAQEKITDDLWKKFDLMPADSSRVDTIISDVVKLKQSLKNSPEEEKMLQSALSLAKRLKYRHGMASSYNLLGVYYREVSQYSDALSFHQKALEIGKETHDSIIISFSLNSMGVAYRRLDENQKAFQYHFDALGVSEAIRDSNGISIALNSIGNIYLSIGDYKNAIEEFEKGLALEKQLGRNIGQAINYANLGACFEKLGEVDKAISYYKQSLKYNTIEDSYKGIAICYNLLGQAYLGKGDYDLALSYLQKAVALNDKLRDKINVAENEITIGRIYQKKNNISSSRKALNEGLRIASEIGSQSLMVDAFKALSETEDLAGAKILAYENLRKAYDLKDSLYKEQATPQMAKMRTLYDLDKKEAQIRLLQQENEINSLRYSNRTYFNSAVIILLGLLLGASIFYLIHRRNKDYRLRLQYELQSLRSQMNPHFIFNALNSIDNFIWKREPDEASAYLVKFSDLMRMTLQNSRANTIFLSSELEFLKLYLELENFRHGGRFSYSIEVSPEVESHMLKIPSMVIQPFVENAILHGLSHKGNGECRLSIRFNKKGDLMECVIEDNGVGREMSKQLKSKETSSRQSLGIEVTEERVRLLKKITGRKDLKIRITDLENGTKGETGTRVSIILPVEEVPESL